MPTTVERIRGFCKAKNIPVSKLEADLGFSNGYLNPKKIKDVPSNRLADIAQYLDEPIESFLGLDELTESIKYLEDLSARAQEEGREEDFPLAEAKAKYDVLTDIAYHAKEQKNASQVLSAHSQRVARLYELADERDRQIIDLMLQKYEAQLPKVIPFVAPKKPAATLHRQARNDGFEDLDTFDQPSAAGLGNYLDVPVAQKEQYPLGIIPAGTSFGILISGDSMEPKIQNRATAFVQSAPAIDSGEIGIFVLNGQSYCKQLVIDRKKREVRLHSLNSKYEDITIHENDELRTIGRVLGSYPPVGMGAKPFEP